MNIWCAKKFLWLINHNSNSHSNEVSISREHTKAVRPIDHSLEHNSLKHMKQTLPIYLLHRKYHSTFTTNTNLSNLSFRLEKHQTSNYFCSTSNKYNCVIFFSFPLKTLNGWNQVIRTVWRHNQGRHNKIS